jgi:hypothetical protein
MTRWLASPLLDSSVRATAAPRQSPPARARLFLTRSPIRCRNRPAAPPPGGRCQRAGARSSGRAVRRPRQLDLPEPRASMSLISGPVHLVDPLPPGSSTRKLAHARAGRRTSALPCTRSSHPPRQTLGLASAERRSRNDCSSLLARVDAGARRGPVRRFDRVARRRGLPTATPVRQASRPARTTNPSAWAETFVSAA